MTLKKLYKKSLKKASIQKAGQAKPHGSRFPVCLQLK